MTWGQLLVGATAIIAGCAFILWSAVKFTKERDK